MGYGRWLGLYVTTLGAATAATYYLLTVPTSGGTVATPTAAEHSVGVRDGEPARRRVEHRGLVVASAVTDETSLRQTLSTLVAQARSRGHATALEVEPGFAAIDAMRGGLSEETALRLMDEFNAALRDLPGQSSPAGAPVPLSFDRELVALRQTSTDDERGAHERRAREALAGMGEGARLAAEAEFDAALREAGRAYQPPATPGISDIRAAPAVGREQLIADYITRAHLGPDPAATHALAALNDFAGDRSTQDNRPAPAGYNDVTHNGMEDRQ